MSHISTRYLESIQNVPHVYKIMAQDGSQSCEHSGEFSGSVESREFYEQLSA
jgi:hypothetical protein